MLYLYVLICSHEHEKVENIKIKKPLKCHHLSMVNPSRPLLWFVSDFDGLTSRLLATVQAHNEFHTMQPVHVIQNSVCTW